MVGEVCQQADGAPQPPFMEILTCNQCDHKAASENSLRQHTRMKNKKLGWQSLATWWERFASKLMEQPTDPPFIEIHTCNQCDHKSASEESLRHHTKIKPKKLAWQEHIQMGLPVT